MQQSDLDLTTLFQVLRERRASASETQPARTGGPTILQRVRTLIGGPRRATGRRVGQVGLPSPR